jgi:hypothetical protein
MDAQQDKLSSDMEDLTASNAMPESTQKKMCMVLPIHVFHAEEDVLNAVFHNSIPQKDARRSITAQQLILVYLLQSQLLMM